MRGTTFTTNIGTVDFSKIELMGSMELYFDIADLPEDLSEKISKAVEESKIEYIKYWANVFQEMERSYKEKWGESGVKIVPQLYVYLPEEGKFQYKLSVYYEDIEDSNLSDSVCFEIDITEHESRLKKFIISTLIDRFF